MKLLEAEVQLDLVRKDQISKSTFEGIFETKIKIYTELLNLKADFFKFNDESHVTEVDDPTDDFYSMFMKCREMIEANKLYISQGLAEKFDAWRSKASEY